MNDGGSGDAGSDSVVLRLKNSGMVTIEMIYMPASVEPFTQVRKSLQQDAESIGAHITGINLDSSEFSLVSGGGNDAITHHHLLIAKEDFVFDINFFKNFNSDDLADIKNTMSNVLLLDHEKESFAFESGQRMPLGMIQVDKVPF